MRDVARSHNVDALLLGPNREVRDGEILAGGAGKMGMNVEIGDEFHENRLHGRQPADTDDNGLRRPT